MKAVLKRIPPVVRVYERTATAWRWYAKTRWPLAALRRLNAAVRAISATTHRWQLELDYRIPPMPEWYDQFIGVHYHWRELRQPFTWERGIFNLLVIREGARVLDLCCGGGFFTYYCYSGRASEVVAIDFDQTAIAHARRYNQAPNIRFDIVDIRAGLPDGDFNNIVWDGAIEHFTESEIANIIARLKPLLVHDGILSGHTIQAAPHGLSHHEHEYEFTSREDLARFFTPHFEHVLVLETVYSERHNLYFFASDAPLPLDGAMLRVDQSNLARPSAQPNVAV